MLFSFLYMVLRFVLRVAPAGEARDREVEILVLRHQVKILQRKAPRPKLSRLDKNPGARLLLPPRVILGLPPIPPYRTKKASQRASCGLATRVTAFPRHLPRSASPRRTLP
jgi:hypothetical protein